MDKSPSSFMLAHSINSTNNSNGNDGVDELSVDIVFNTIPDMVEWVVLQNSAVIQTSFLLAYRIMVTSEELYLALHSLITTHQGKTEHHSKLSKLNVFLYMWGELSYHHDWKAAPDRLAKLMELAKATSLSPGQYSNFQRLLVKVGSTL
jgi:hypothetical protein